MIGSLPLFDRPPSGVELREKGIKRGFDHGLKTDPEYVDKCLQVITAFAPARRFTSEDLRDAAGEPPTQHCIAGILKRAASRGLIKNTGEERLAKRATIHAKKICLWERL